MNRIDGRAADELRDVRLQLGWAKHAEGSCLIEFGDTMVLCTASLENSVPPWKRGSGSGWVTGEYGMLPRATGKRNQRDGARGKQDGRTIEIQRLIGRSLRAAIDLEALGERTIVLDCDVLQADGGTRCASITGAWVALAQALHGVDGSGTLRRRALPVSVAAVSVGIVSGTPLLDLCYAEDSKAEVDMNVVMTGAGRLVEVQASGEGATFSQEELGALLQLAGHGLESLARLQQKALAELES